MTDSIWRNAATGIYIRILPVENGWIFFDGTTEHFFETQQEAVQMANKLKTAQAIVTAVQAMTTPTDTGTDLVKEFFDVGTFADADVAALGITAADLGACITLLEQVGKLMTGQATAVADYTATLNKVRRV
jgi:hypothetical protein